MSHDSIVPTVRSFDEFECPGIDFHTERNGFNPKKGLRSLYGNLHTLGRQFCLYRCADCNDRLSEGEKERRMFWNGDLSEFFQAIKRAHDAAGQLPDIVFQHLYTLANNNCPVCAVLAALRHFPAISRHSDARLISESSLPCFWGRKTNETNWGYDDSYLHIEALHCLSLEKLPSSLLPAEEYEIRTKIAPGKAVLTFIDNHQNSGVRIPVQISDEDLWDILQWHPQVNTWGAYDISPQKTWKKWAKSSFVNCEIGDSVKRLCCLLHVALNCYDAVSKKSHSVTQYHEAAGLHEDRLKLLFDTWLLLSEERGWFDYNFILSEALSKNFIQQSAICDHFHNHGNYYKLTFLGKKASRDSIGAPPAFVDAFDELWQGTPEPAKNTGINDIFVGAGGKGGDGGMAGVVNDDHSKTINAPSVVASPTNKMEEGAIQNSNVITTNIAGQGEVVKETRETVFQALEWAKNNPEFIKTSPAISDKGKKKPGRPSGTDKERDAKHAAGWERYIERGKRKHEYVEDNDDIKDVDELNRILDRHRSARKKYSE